MNKTNYKKEQGAALLIGLVMIFMLSILGVSSMRGSTLERRMATNSIQTATTFQGAESTSEIVLNDEKNMTRAFEISNVKTLIDSKSDEAIKAVTVKIDLKQDIGMESTAELRYLGTGPAIGFSTGDGSSNFVALRYEVKGDSKVESVRSRARVTQGAYRIAPGN